MNYYTFKNFPRLDIKTFHSDGGQTTKQSCKYINSLMVKFIWGYESRGRWYLLNYTDIKYWFER